MPETGTSINATPYSFFCVATDKLPRMAKTPMMQQYEDAKAVCGDALLFFRMGDFYELFHDDAKVAAKLLGLTLTSRDKSADPIPMAGFPHHQLQSYLGKLIRQGYRAAVCEQVEDPKTAKGLVKREITRVVTPGTVTDEELLDPLESNYLAAIAPQIGKGKTEEDDVPVGIAWADLSTGHFFAAVIPARELQNHLARIAAVEVLVSEDDRRLGGIKQLNAVSTRPAWTFAQRHAHEILHKQFQVHSLEGFGFTGDDESAIRAAGALLEYLNETQRVSLDHIERLTKYQTSEILEIDEATRRSLELTRTMREGNRSGSLLDVINRTVTPMGARQLALWLANPLTCRDEIVARQQAVGEFVKDAQFRSNLRKQLDGISDLQRLLAKVATGRAGPRDLVSVGQTLARMPKIKAMLTGRKSLRISSLENEIHLCAEVRSAIDAALKADCPIQTKDGGYIKSGCDQKLDELRGLAAGGKQWIADYQASIIASTGINNLKVGYNRVFGYYLETSNANRDKVPDFFIRKQTLKNAERYITPELKEYEEKVLAADERALALELEIFQRLREKVADSARLLQQNARTLSTLDVLSGLAELAAQRSYCQPEILDEPILEIEDGRHPVLDLLESQGTFVSNDTHLGGDSGELLLITGPNMAGKSTYIRQVALITLMAQIGSFVPARQARVGIADRIFARVGASDELSRGQSTFMVEMTETARILNCATSQSLVVLDEIGRGTSTYDGVSLAWAIVEHIHDRIGCRTLFATHYHELTDLENSLDKVRNLNVAVKEWNDDLVFLHKIVPGATDKSYGIHVARLAGIPPSVNERAKQILAQLESEHAATNGKTKASRRVVHRPRHDLQLTLFAPQEHPLLDEVRRIDLNHVTPLQAFEQLQKWKADLDEKVGQ
jgi:DNA mismatch repair protein MutS